MTESQWQRLEEKLCLEAEKLLKVYQATKPDTAEEAIAHDAYTRAEDAYARAWAREV